MLTGLGNDWFRLSELNVLAGVDGHGDVVRGIDPQTGDGTTCSRHITDPHCKRRPERKK